MKLLATALASAAETTVFSLFEIQKSSARLTVSRWLAPGQCCRRFFSFDCFAARMLSLRKASGR
jgi:hypothetical protein